jgi:hypothetical protein
VERLGRDVGAVRPDARADLLVERDLAEVRRVSERLEDASPVLVRELDVSLGAILEGRRSR